MVAKPITKAMKARMAADKAAKEAKVKNFEQELKNSKPKRARFLMIETQSYGNPCWKYRLAMDGAIVDGEIPMSNPVIPDWEALIKAEKETVEAYRARERAEMERKTQLMEQLRSLLPSHMTLGIGSYRVSDGRFIVTVLGGQLEGYWKPGDPTPDWDNLTPFQSRVQHRSKLAKQTDATYSWAQGDDLHC